MTTLTNLIERVERGVGADVRLDEDIHAALFPYHHFAQLADAPAGCGCMMYKWPNGTLSSALRITASIDAALYLVEIVRPDSNVDIEIRPGMSNGRVHQSTDATIYGHVHGPDEDKNWRGYASTPQHSIVLALLRSKLSESPLASKGV